MIYFFWIHVLPTYEIYINILLNSTAHIPSFSQRSVCTQKIKTIKQTIPNKKEMQICYPGYFGYVQAHLPETRRFFEIFDEGLSPCKYLKQYMNPFMWYFISKNSAVRLVIWTCLTTTTKNGIISLSKILMMFIYMEKISFIIPFL